MLEDAGLELRFDEVVGKGVFYKVSFTSSPHDYDRFVNVFDRLSDEERELFSEDYEILFKSIFYKKVDSRHFGEIEYRDYPDTIFASRRLVCEQFFPFNLFVGRRFKYLTGKGIADKIQLWVAEELTDMFTLDIPVMHESPSASRKFQLSRLGIRPGVLYPLREYLWTIRSNIEEK